MAGAPSPEGAFSRRTPYRLGRPHPRAAPSGGAGGIAGRWGIRRYTAPAHPAAGRLVLRMSHGHEHHSDVGGRDLPPGCARLLSQAGEADRVKRGLRHSRGVWANYGAVLLGQGAILFGTNFAEGRGPGRYTVDSGSNRGIPRTRRPAWPLPPPLPSQRRPSKVSSTFAYSDRSSRTCTRLAPSGTAPVTGSCFT